MPEYFELVNVGRKTSIHFPFSRNLSPLDYQTRIERKTQRIISNQEFGWNSMMTEQWVCMTQFDMTSKKKQQIL